jgi:hypothetical protein
MRVLEDERKMGMEKFNAMRWLCSRLVDFSGRGWC